jgi:hypothetical protein
MMPELPAVQAEKNREEVSHTKHMSFRLRFHIYVYIFNTVRNVSIIGPCVKKFVISQHT